MARMYPILKNAPISNSGFFWASVAAVMPFTLNCVSDSLGHKFVQHISYMVNGVSTIGQSFPQAISGQVRFANS
jgi:hypothetical protein